MGSKSFNFVNGISCKLHCRWMLCRTSSASSQPSSVAYNSDDDNYWKLGLLRQLEIQKQTQQTKKQRTRASYKEKIKYSENLQLLLQLREAWFEQRTAKLFIESIPFIASNRMLSSNWMQ